MKPCDYCSCKARAKHMQSSCKDHAKIMQGSCKYHAKIMQSSCEAHAKLTQSSCKCSGTVTVCLNKQQLALQAHEVDAPNISASFKQFHVDQVAADMKESICRVSDGPFDAQENAHVPTVSYEVAPFTLLFWLCTASYHSWSSQTGNRPLVLHTALLLQAHDVKMACHARHATPENSAFAGS